MFFKPFARALVLVSVCALFTAVASKPARFAQTSPEKHLTKLAGHGTQTLKQFNARAMHASGTHTHDRRQASPLAADRVTPADDEDAAAPTPANLVHLSVAAQPTNLSRRQGGNTGLASSDLPSPIKDLSSNFNVAEYVGDLTSLTGADNTAVEPISQLASL